MHQFDIGKKDDQSDDKDKCIISELGKTAHLFRE